MQPAPRFDAPRSGAQRVPVALPCGRYSIVGKLRTQGRADISIGLPEGGCSVDELVVIKSWASDAVEGTARELPPEIELSSTLRHDNLVRTLGVGHEAGRHFIVSEYLEGTTLRRLLRWLSAQRQSLPNAAIARILLGIFAAVEHADRFARNPHARAIVRQPIGADDVFITYEGSVKLLGFKTQPARVAAAECRSPGESAAVDDLLSNQRSPELSAVLARIGNRVSAASLIGLWQIARILQIWQTEELESDGRAELAGAMAGVLPEGRAKRRAQLATACARVLRGSPASGEWGDALAESPPVSGYRVTRLNGSLGAASVVPWPPPEVAVPTTALVRLASSDAPAAYPLTVSRGRRAIGWRWPTRHWISIVLLLTALGLAVFGVRYPHRLEPGPAAVLPADVVPGAVVPAELGPAARSSVATAPGAHRAPPAPATGEDVAPPSFARPRATSPVGMVSPALAALQQSPAARGRRPNDDRSPLSSTPAPAPSAPPGYLTLDTTPWSAVSIGKVSLGQTPLVRVQLPPGQHVLELDNEELGIATSVIVGISSGETTVRRIGLERPVHAAAP